MNGQFLYEKLNILKEAGITVELPKIIESCLSNKILLKEYQKEAFKNFISYFENNNFRKNKQVYLLHPGLQCITELLHRPSKATDHAPASFENFFPFDIGFAGRTKAIGAFAGHLRLKALAQHLDRIAAPLEADTLGIFFFVARRDAIVKGQHILFPD